MARTPEQTLFQAYCLEQLGRFADALEAYRQALPAMPGNMLAQVRYWRLLRDLKPPPPLPITAIWQLAPDKSWEREWVRYLLSSLSCSEIVDGGHNEFHDNALVIDNFIGPSKRPYYLELLKRGHRFGLIHLSDERYVDDCSAYEYANVVIRNYWSAHHCANRRVLTVPLGTTNGFVAQATKAASARKHLWSFAGEINKSTRMPMVEALNTLDAGFVHPSGLSSNPIPRARAPLGIAEYSALLSDTIFAPCPSGWENLDSFRVYEALDAGCIPIVERRPGYDYFRLFLGEHPILTIDDWKHAPAAIRLLLNDGAALEKRRQTCADWWQTTRCAYVARVRDHITLGFAGASATPAHPIKT
jgi:hypothetical protein